MVDAATMERILAVINESKPYDAHLSSLNVGQLDGGRDEIVLRFRYLEPVFKKGMRHVIRRAISQASPEAKFAVRFSFESKKELKRNRPLSYTILQLPPRPPPPPPYIPPDPNRPGAYKWWRKQGLSHAAGRTLVEIAHDLDKDCVTRDDLIEDICRLYTAKSGYRRTTKCIPEIKKFFDIDFIIPPP